MKIGDIVRPKVDSPYGGGSPRNPWDYPMRITDISDESVFVEVLEGPFAGRAGCFQPHRLEVVDVNKSSTDQELADEYRRLRTLAYLVAVELENRGYSFKFLSKLAGRWYEGSVPESPEEFAFTKQVSETIWL